MKTLKKTLSVLLVTVMLFTSLFTVCANAADKEIVPVIVVGGFSSSDLFLDYGLDTEEHVWSLNVNSVLKKVEKNLDKLGISLINASKGDKKAIINAVSEVLIDVCDVLTCNDDGTSKYNVGASMTDPAITSTSAIVEKYGEGSGYIQLPRINNYFCDEVGSDNVFNCHVDFRKGAVECAQALDSYVQAVKEYTGAKQVSLFGLSHGGMTIGVFMNLVANYPEMVKSTCTDIKKAIMFHPALSGAAFLDDFMENNLKLDVAQIAEYAEVGALSEYQLEILLHLDEVGILNSIANALLDKVFLPLVGNWGSIWDFAAPDKYEGWKSEYLDAQKNAQIIENSDFMHYKVMPTYHEAFTKAQAQGVDIQIMAGYGRTVVTGNKLNTDSILSTASTTGAKTAPSGKRFANGYTQTGLNCTNPAHNHVSPTMEVDASYAYLPENTFYVYRQFHGQAWFDDYTMNLCLKLLFTDEIKDVYSSDDYSQFEYSRTAKDEVYIKFDGAGSTGRLAPDAKGVYLTNASKKYSIKLTSMFCDNLDLKFNIDKKAKIAPGQTVYIPFEGSVPQENMVFDKLNVTYVQYGAVSNIGIRTIPFCVVNENNGGYDDSNPFNDFGDATNYLSFRLILSTLLKLINLLFARIGVAI